MIGVGVVVEGSIVVLECVRDVVSDACGVADEEEDDVCTIVADEVSGALSTSVVAVVVSAPVLVGCLVEVVEGSEVVARVGDVVVDGRVIPAFANAILILDIACSRLSCWACSVDASGRIVVAKTGRASSSADNPAVTDTDWDCALSSCACDVLSSAAVAVRASVLAFAVLI